MNTKKIVYVVAGALVNNKHQVLMAQRPEGKNLAGYWEFPGGKIEIEETPEEALVRELKEELNLNINIIDLKPLTFASHDYKDFHLVMPLFLCKKWEGNPESMEKQSFAWINIEDLNNDPNRPLAPADIEMAKTIQKLL
ncbi:MAG: (deoxy)nucleoside triphosphate pyrophosphohydrolase [Alphaproteobacteria bacterium]|nr:(deoxy)nucleoside triphosphate pyrophosphohydrolase [Alphaproteobacteria bacterium]